MVAAWYYLRIVGVMYFRGPSATLRAEGGRGALWAAALCAMLVLALGVYPGPLSRASRTASPTFKQPATTTYAARTDTGRLVGINPYGQPRREDVQGARTPSAGQGNCICVRHSAP